MRQLPVFILLVFSACSVPLEKRTGVTPNIPFEIILTGPNAPGNFYDILYDSLDKHIYKINKSGLSTIVNGAEDQDHFIGWLQDQFDDYPTGIGLKAGSKIDKDRTSEEVNLKNKFGPRADKFSFTVNFRVDSIPDEFLYPDLWKKATADNRFKERIEAERKEFERAGRVFRTRDGIKDTLFIYGYTLPLDITLNYYQTEEKRWLRSTFTIITETGVYHQVKFR